MRSGISFQAATLGGRIFSTLFLTVFAAFGVFFCGLMAREGYHIGRTYTWQKTECVILESKVTEQSNGGNHRYLFEVKYQYSWQGKTYVCDRFSGTKQVFPQYDKAQRLVQQYKEDTRASCYVNPSEPSSALLTHQSLWFGVFMIIPLIFVAFGFGGIYSLWSGTRARASEQAGPPQPITDQARKGLGSVGLSLFFLIFFVAGSAAAWSLAIYPAIQIIAARSWTEVPCTILSSSVQTHHGDNDTYTVDVLYAYTFAEQEYKSSRYHFVGGSSSGYNGKAQIVRRYPPGRRTVCYVNPRDPLQAVLHRGFSPDMWWGILFPIPFIAVGLGGAYFTLRKKREASNGLTASVSVKSRVQPHGFPTLRTAPDGSLVLKRKTSRVAALLIVIGMAVFWNGIVSVFLSQVVQSWARHRPEWFLTLFMIPFVVIGLGLIGGIGYMFLQLFNPTVEFAIRPAAAHLGDLLDVRWAVKGKTSRIEKLRIYVEGREEVTYRRGTSSATDKNVFATFELLNLGRSANVHSGSVQLKIPADTMHSFASKNNKVIWAIQVHGDIPRWPDIKDEFPLTIQPLPVQPQRRV